MPSTKVQIWNLGLLRLGEALLTSVTEDSNPRRVCEAIYDQVLEETLAAGPEFGWRFAGRRGSVNVNNTAITAVADHSGTVSGTVLVTAAEHDLQTGDTVTITDTTSYNGDHVITVVTDDTFYFTATFVATETGTVQWTSDEFKFRFPKPTSLRVIKVSVNAAQLTDWKREDIYLLTSQEDTTVIVEYVQSITNEALFPSHFAKVLYMNMAAHLAYDLVQNRALSDRLLVELETVHMPRAVALDAKELFVEEDNQDWRDVGHAGGTRQNFNLPKLTAAQVAQSNIT